jgi:hypothetical protein
VSFPILGGEALSSAMSRPDIGLPRAKLGSPKPSCEFLLYKSIASLEGNFQLGACTLRRRLRLLAMKGTAMASPRDKVSQSGAA